MPTKETVFYTAPIERIGCHEWILQVYVHSSFYERCTRYWWRRVGEMVWRQEADWPRYDPHDGTTAGLPRRLSAYYQRHHDAIQVVLEGNTPPPPRQEGLFDVESPP